MPKTFDHKDCIEWEGKYYFKDGELKYGTVTYKGRTRPAHRVVYAEMSQNPIEALDGLEVVRLCFNRKCVNIDHMDAVTPKNRCLLQAVKGTFDKKQKDKCHRGHVFDDKNTKIHYDSTGKRFRNCRKCGVIRTNKWKQKNLDYVKAYNKRYKKRKNKSR